ncbi:MAG: TIGR01244 family sulfur transferase [Gemmobacter sp.]|uniref:TIGR01244 family sulfur transferase n=1 Tax=Gemmobacter sp. TaxID=1898957 RepID=UPI00391DEEB7
MDIRQITPDYAVSPQIDPADLPAIKAAGFTRVVNNRPDGEIPPSHQSAAMKAAAEAAGLDYVENPVVGGAITPDNVTAQGAALQGARVLAYCASGNRSSIVWALSQAGKRPTDELIALPARHGYNMEIWRDQIEALAARA